jgi:hypothetical protein
LNVSGRSRSEIIAKCTVEPPTPRPQLLPPSAIGSAPALILGSVQ